MARGLREHEIFDLLGDGNISDIIILDISDEVMEDQFDNEKLQQLLNDFEQWEDQDEVNETESEIIYNQTSINFNVTEKKIKWDRVPFCPPELKLKDLEERNYPPEMPSITDYFYEYLNDDIFEKMVY